MMKKEVGKKIGYVRASYYAITNGMKIYEINFDKKNNQPMTKLSMAPIDGHSNVYIFLIQNSFCKF